MYMFFLNCLIVVCHSISFTIHTNTTGPGNSVLIPEFLSITVDQGVISHWNEFGFNNTLVNTLAKGIVPVFFRFGGTSADETTYNITGPVTFTVPVTIDHDDDASIADTATGSTLLAVSSSGPTLTSPMLSTLADFVIRNEWKWIFGINQQKRTNVSSSNPRGVFDTKNAQSLISAFLESNSTNISNIFYAFELGNEPDEYIKHSNFYNLTGQEVAQDFYVLYQLLNNLYTVKLGNAQNKNKNKNKNNNDENNNNENANRNAKATKKSQDNGNDDVPPRPKIFGCDVATNMAYLEPFLNESARISVEKTNSMPFFDGITYHHYYGSAATYTLHDFIKIEVLDSLINHLNGSIVTRDKDYTSSSNSPFFSNTPIMLGETSSTYGGGSANLSASFAAGFLWLDKLGLSSIWGMYSVMRQTFWGGNYALVGISPDHLPNPDYFSSLLFKTLVGQFGQSKTLYVDNEFERGRNIRVYAFCTNVASSSDDVSSTRMGNKHQGRNKEEKKIGEIVRESKIKDVGYNYTVYETGSVTLLILNLQNNTVEFDVDLSPKIENTTNIYYDEYILTSYPGVLNSRAMFLNGEYIEMIDNTTLPVLAGIKKEYGSTIEMPALSYGFVVVAGAQADNCMS